MRPADALLLAFEDIRAAKLRSALTALGIVVGVGAVTLMLAIGHGVTSTVTDAFTSLGSTRLTVFPSAPHEDDRTPRFGGGFVAPASTLTVQDAEALATVEAIKAVAPVLEVGAQVAGPAARLPLAVRGTSPAFLDITSSPPTAGRAFTPGTAEAVLDATTAGHLFGSASPLGRELLVNGTPYRVVGLLRETTEPFLGLRPGGDAEAVPTVLIPIEAALELADTDHVAQIVATASDPQHVDDAAAAINTRLRARHGGVGDFSVTSVQQLVASFTRVFDVVTAGLAAIAGISLFVGGIGIMNIMLATVTERTREIGISRAIGGGRGAIVSQFVLEAMLVSLLGGLTGLASAWLGSAVLRRGLSLPSTITSGAVILAIAVSAGVGLVFAAGPALRAARLDPVAALRRE